VLQNGHPYGEKTVEFEREVQTGRFVKGAGDNIPNKLPFIKEGIEGEAGNEASRRQSCIRRVSGA